MVVRKAILRRRHSTLHQTSFISPHIFHGRILSTLRDFAKLKAQVFGGSPHLRYDNETACAPHSIDQGTARVSVRLVDTMLIAPAGRVTGIAWCHAGCAKG